MTIFTNFSKKIRDKRIKLISDMIDEKLIIQQSTINLNHVNIPLLVKDRDYREKKAHKGEEKLIAVFCDLEYLHRSAITVYSVKTFCQFPEKFHIFTKFSCPNYANQILNEIQQIVNLPLSELNIFDADSYIEMDLLNNYRANIFVLGDSVYNLKTFDYAIKLYQYREKNYLYFHDGMYIGLLYLWANKHNYAWQEFLVNTYPDYDLSNGQTTEDLLSSDIHMVKLVLKFTGSSHIFINANNCIPIIEKEADSKTVNIVPTFLPIPDYRSIKPKNLAPDKLVIAHFGILNDFKQIDKLIRAVELLKNQKKDEIEVILLLAGYGVKSYVDNLSSHLKEFILVEESPSSQVLLSLMKGADIAVQLRWPIMGMASAVVSEMLGLGIKCITTEGFVNESFKDYVIEVPHNISTIQLAKTILNNYGKMSILPNDHANLLKNFSYQAAAELMFNKATQGINKDISAPSPKKLKNLTRMNLNLISENNELKKRKLRILYGATHRVLRYEEVSLFIKAGFEVIPVKAHWEIFKTYEPGSDDPAHPLYPEWRNSCSIPQEIIEKIQNIDIFKYDNLNDAGGVITSEEAAIINEWIDIIYVPNLLPTVPRVLNWFDGLTLFRVYGEGKIMTYDEWALASGVDMNVLKEYDSCYAAMLMLHSLNGPEHASILGSSVFQVGPCVTRDRIKSRWKGESATNICNTALSYISENPHWTDIYNEFCQLFKDVPLRILGKNSKVREPNKSDDRVIGIVNNDFEYSSLLTDCRCFIDPGTSPFHTHYTPLEAIIMGIPVIFLWDSGMGQEILRIIPKEQLQDSGICENFKEAIIVVKRCLNDFNYAQQIADKQRIIAEKMFSPDTVLKQIQLFAKKAPALVEKAKSFSCTEKKTNINDNFADSFRIFSQANPTIFSKPIVEELPSNLKAVESDYSILIRLMRFIFIVGFKIVRAVYKKLTPCTLHERISYFFFKCAFPEKETIYTRCMKNLNKQVLLNDFFKSELSNAHSHIRKLENIIKKMTDNEIQDRSKAS